MNHAAERFGKSEKASLLVGEPLVTEIDEDLIPKFREEKTKQITWRKSGIENISCVVTLYKIMQKLFVL